MDNPIPFEQEFPEAGEVFVDLLKTHAGRIQLNRLMNSKVELETKVGRNDPCPCGSGRKYKKCCLGK